MSVVGRQRPYFVMMIPLIAVTSVLILFPLGLAVALSFSGWNLAEPGSNTFIGFANYRKILFDDMRFWMAFKNSVLYIVGPVTVQVAIGFGVALLLRHVRMKFHSMLRGLLLFPMVVPPVVAGIAWRILLIPGLGGVNFYLKTVGVQAPDWLGNPFWALATIMAATTWMWTPFVAIMLLAGLESLPADPYEAARVDGANRWQCFANITVPLLRPTLLTVCLLRAIEGLKVFPLIFTITEGGPGTTTEDMNYYTFIRGFRYYEMGYAFALAAVIFIIVLAWTLGVRTLVPGFRSAK